MTIEIRDERPGDAAAIRAIHLAAFPAAGEADLVDRLRASGAAVVSRVAEDGGAILGHVVFSPVTIGAARGLGLAPLAVLPLHQRCGVGGALVRDGLEACARRGCGFVVVLGHPEYYPRFGFRPGSESGVASEFGGGPSFMVVELSAGALPAGGGLARYGPEFDVWRPR